jgi:UDP-N-acetylmuramate dehydrogenase
MASSSLWRENIAALHFVNCDEALSRHTTMKVGGPAALWAQPANEEELSEILRRVWHYEAPFFVVGAGSNLVASDEGFDGVVLHLGEGFGYSRAQENCLVAGGAAFLPRLTHFCLENRLGNMEWACGIPGSLGGSVWGNAGARGFNGRDFEGRDCGHDFVSCVAFDRQGRRHELTRDDVQFSYRHTSLGELIVTEATFALKPLSLEEAALHKKAVRDLLERRRLTQPVNAASAGCIWRNPQVDGCAGAGALVEQLGLKGRAVGGARISEIHGNFVINSGNATAGEVRRLIGEVESEAARRTGIVLVREARFVG